MSLRRLLVHDVTIVTATTTTGTYGDAEKDWANAVRVTTKGWVSQRSSSEALGDREAQVSEWVLFLMPDETIVAGNRVEWSGITFEVDGPPNPAWTPRGPHHLEANLKAVEG